MTRGITWHASSPLLKTREEKEKSPNPQMLTASLHAGLSFLCGSPATYSILGPRSCPKKPIWQEQAPVAAATVIIHLTVYYLHMSSAAVEHRNSSVCVISHRTAAISCSGPWQNTTWWLFQTQAKTAEAEGSATKPGYLLFIIQFPDWWFHKPAAKCCVLYCQQTNGLNGRRENNVQDWGNQLYWGN